MPELELWLLALALVGLVLGAWGILWARFSRTSGRSLCGRGMFIVAIVFLAVTSSVAAFHRAEGLVPLGLTAGFLVIGMLWEVPPHTEPEEPEILAEET
jgi:hypothetical protein